jgi:O-antigen/teichoic acid export membrane protein
MKSTAALSHRELLSEVAPVGFMLAVMQSFSVIFASSDQLLLGYLVEPSKAIAMVAIYSLATSLASVLFIFPGSVGNIFLPVVSRLAGKNDMDRMRAVLETAQRWSLFITLPCAITLMSFSADILRVFYGSAYTSGAATLAIFTIGLVFFCMSYMTLLALAALRLVRVEFGITLAIGVVNLVLNVLLIPRFGLEGAAAASTIGFGVGLLLLQHYGEQLLGFRFPPEIWRLLAAAVLVFVVLLAVDPWVSSLSVLLPLPGAGATQVYFLKLLYLVCLAVLVLLSMLLFMGCALLLKCFRKEDISLMKGVMRRAMMPPSLISLAGKVASYGVSDRI